MPERPFGRTGHHVRLFSLGGQATLEKEGTRDTSVAIINRAIDLGVNYLDTAAAYGRGISQTYIGEVMATRRKEVFLATKTRSRDRDGALRDLEQSLKSLQTDHVDLWQNHNVMRDEEVEQMLGKGGALEAMLQARDQKMIRFIGITGHFDPAVLAKAIQRFEFDTVLMALNPADKHRLSFIQELLPLANAKKMGIIGMKIPARGRIFKPGGITSIKDPMRYVLTLPGQHGHHRLRHRGAARRERPDREDLHADAGSRDDSPRGADGQLRRRSGVLQETSGRRGGS